MRDLMRDDAGQLRFVFDRLKQTALNEKKPSGQRKGVDLLAVENRHIKGHPQVGVLADTLRQIHDLLPHRRVVDLRRHQAGQLHLPHRLLTVFDVVLLARHQLPEADVLHIPPAAPVMRARG